MEEVVRDDTDSIGEKEGNEDEDATEDGGVEFRVLMSSSSLTCSSLPC